MTVRQSGRFNCRIFRYQAKIILNAGSCNSRTEFSEGISYRLLYYEQIPDTVTVISIQTLISQSDGLNG